LATRDGGKAGIAVKPAFDRPAEASRGDEVVESAPVPNAIRLSVFRGFFGHFSL
jgi:hypothetical protein